MTVLGTALMVLLGILVVTVAACGAMGRRWRLRHGKPPASWVLEPDLHRPGSPFSASQRRTAEGVVRRGTAAEGPETAHIAYQIARQSIRQLENPWNRGLRALFLAFQAVTFSGIALLNSTEPMRSTAVLCAVGLMGLAVCLPFHQSHRLRRARASLQLNEELARQAPPGGGTR